MRHAAICHRQDRIPVAKGSMMDGVFHLNSAPKLSNQWSPPLLMTPICYDV